MGKIIYIYTGYIISRKGCNKVAVVNGPSYTPAV